MLTLVNSQALRSLPNPPSPALRRAARSVLAEAPEADHTLWTRDLKLTGSPLPLLDGRILARGKDAAIHVLDREGRPTGSYAARDRLQHSLKASPDGSVLYGTDKGRLSAVDATTGALLWERVTGGDLGPGYSLDRQGRVLLGHGLDVVCLDGRTGKPLWTYPTAGKVTAAPLPGENGFVYAGSRDGRLYAMDAETGEHRWEYRAENGFSLSPSLAADGTLMAAAEGCRMLWLDAATGTERAKADLGSWVMSGPVPGPGGLAISTSNRFQVEARTPGKAVPVWSAPTGNLAVGAPATGPDGTIYAAGSNSRLLALDPSTGAVRWAATPGKGASCGPVLTPDGRLLITDDTGRLHAYWTRPDQAPQEGPAPPAGSIEPGPDSVRIGGIRLPVQVDRL